MKAFCLPSALALLSLVLPFGGSTVAAEFQLKTGDHICYVGNTLAERMQHDGWLETAIQARYPELQLVFRNLGFSGDELTDYFEAGADKTTRLRSEAFGTPDEHLAHSGATVVFAFFGYNESFAGDEGLPKFREELAEFITHTLEQKYNGEDTPRLVIFSPIAHEDLDDPNLPSGEENNARLVKYTEVMRVVAAEHDVPFVDLFSASQEMYRAAAEPLTINGIHLTSNGNARLADAIVDKLLPDAPPPQVAGDEMARLREAVLDKNFRWFNRYRTVDGYNVYGGRSWLKFVDGQTNRDVMQREMEILDVMTANRDKRVWAVASGSDLNVDDSNTPPHLDVPTNKPGPGPDGSYVFHGGEEAIQYMTPGEGLKVSLFASEEMFPELANPVQMAFDTQGRLWVAVMPSYPHWKPGDEMNDKVLIFEDTNGDGLADVCKTFADGLHVPTGLEFWNGGLLLGHQPDLMFLKDTDGDDVADVRQRILHGIDSADTHHALNSFVLSPGGALYFQEGTFHHTQVETPYGPPVRSANAAVFRYEPFTHKFEVYVPYGFANPHGHVYDHWGQDFVTDGTGNVNYYAAPFSTHLEYPQKHSRYFPFFEQWVRPAGATEIMYSRHFPEEFQGDYLICNVIGFLGILRYNVEDDGSGFRGVEDEYIVKSTDENFRPVDVEVGPDGAIWFLDWQNPIIGHMQHNLRDPSRDQSHGRIYRVTHEGRDLLEPPAIEGESIAELLELLKSPEYRVRYRAKIELSEHDSDHVIAAVNEWIQRLEENDPGYQHHLLEALWMHQYHNRPNEKLLARMLRSPDYRARAAATRVLCYWRDQVSESLALLEQQVNDDHPRVRLEAVRACSFFEDARAAEVALEALQYGTDKFLDYTLQETMRALEPYWKDALRRGEAFAAENPAGSEYILKSVDTPELLKMARTEPVYTALLTRDGVPHDFRHEAVMGLAKLRGTHVMEELLSAMERLDKSDAPHAEQVMADIAHMLTSQPAETFAAYREQIEELATSAERPVTRRIAYVTLITADQSLDRVWGLAVESLGTLRDFIEAVPLLPDAKLRAAAHPKIEPLLEELPSELAANVASSPGTAGRYVRIELPGRRRTLSLAEVEVISGGQNIAPRGKATQSSTAHNGTADKAIDGNKSPSFFEGGQTHTQERTRNPWWELDLGTEQPIQEIAVYNRSGDYGDRLDGFTIQVLDANRKPVFTQSDVDAPERIVRFEMEGDPAGAIHRAAINAITYTGVEPTETFSRLAEYIRAGREREAAVKALSRLPRSSWPEDQVLPLAQGIIAYIRELPTDERTTPAALDALALGEQLARALPRPQGTEIRQTLRELGVHVIRLRPVPHQMRYDLSQIFVEAGKPVEIVLENIDVMPHNLVITQPGAYAAVGIASERMATDPDAIEKEYVPDMPQVMNFTKLLQPGQTDRIRFTAPKEIGDYPYVCTYPGHWRRMYGTMHVVESLDDVPLEALAPASDPEIQTREFVQAWNVEDLAGDLASAAEGRNFQRAQELFQAVSCVQCHKLDGGEGGQVGPDLASVQKKMAEENWTRLDILKEMITPSERIDENYQTVIIEDVTGRVHTGIVTARDDETVELMSNPLEGQGKNVVNIPVENIGEEFPSKISMMPEGLLNTLTKEEILDLVLFIETGGDGNHPAFRGGGAATGGESEQRHSHEH